MKSILTLTAALAIAALPACQGPKTSPMPAMPAYKGSAELERMKTLAGKWHGTGPMGPVEIEYKVTAAGSMVQECILKNTPMEMLSTYYDEGGKLAMTHYCALHNRPHMKLIKSTPDSLSFDFVPSPGINASRDMHMHSAKITFIDANHIRSEGSSWNGGKPQATCAPMVLTRQ